MTFQSILKRIFDFTASLLGLIVFSPLFLFLAVLVKYDSDGPVFFKQERAGKGGKKFKIWKFRTMVCNQEIFTIEKTREFETRGIKDPRVTKIGFFLRRSGLDELPQLINILRGEMSFVGPRPLYLPRYEVNPKLKKRLVVMPGLTCLGVASGGSHLSEDEIFQMDLDYIRRKNFYLDINILVKTLILYIKKAYGTRKI